MKTNYVNQLKADYLKTVEKTAKENFDYFMVGNAYEAGMEQGLKLGDDILDLFLQKMGHFIQGIDSEELLDYYQKAKQEALNHSTI